MQVILTIFVSILIPNAIAFSSGDVSVCNAYAKWGCPNSAWRMDSRDRPNRLDCDDSTGEVGLMDWVAPPVRTSNYSVRTGDDDRPDKKVYEPGKLMNIYVRVLEYDWQFRGLLLYAVDEDGITVGSWEFPTTESSPYYWTPPNSACRNKVLHTTAARKPLRNVLYFRAPEKGTGKITFHCLIKKGPANHGYFYYPMDEDLTLNEDTTPVKSTWYKADPGQSCNAKCQSLRLPCDVTTMKSATTPAGFSSGVSREFLCNVPPIGSCADNAPLMSDNGDCYYHTEICEDWRKKIDNKGEVTCDSIDAKNSRLCVCGSGSKDPNNPNHKNNPNNPDYKPFSSGTKIKPHNHLALQLLAGLITLFSGKKNNYFLFSAFILLLFVGSCDAHNWMHTPGRAYTQASTIKPCLGRKTSDTHAQVVINKNNPQMFSLQWATGHGGFSYFLVLKGEDSYYMGDPDLVKIMNDYIANAPVKDGHTAVEDLQRFHGASPGADTMHDATLDSMVGDGQMFKEQISQDSTIYKQLTGNPGTKNRKNDVMQRIWRYNTDRLAPDARVSYKSEKYPWIEAVYKYLHSTHFPADFDGIALSIDGHHGAGHYIVHWRWNGYYDCMDIDVRQPTPQLAMIPNVYGDWDGSSMIWNRVDHCQYIKPNNIITPCAQSPVSADWCKNKISSRTDRRYGINVVPFHQPKTVFPKFQSLKTNIPWEHSTCVSDSWTELDGTITENKFNVGGWTNKVTHNNKICSSAGEEEELSLKQAVINCAIQKGCTGISFKKASGSITSDADDLIFKVCDDIPTVSDNEWTTYLKKEINPVSTMKSPEIKISFQPKLCHVKEGDERRTEQRSGNRDCFDVAEFEMPDGWLADSGDLYGKRKNGRTYGWSCTAHPGPDPTKGCIESEENEWSCIGHTHRSRKNFRALDAKNPTINNTVIRNLHHSCHPYFTTNSDGDPPFKYRWKNRSRWEIEVPNGVYRVRTTHTYDGSREIRVGGCMVENRRISPDRNEYWGWATLDTEVEVLDGRITFEGITFESTGGQFDCYGMTTMEIKMVYTKYPGSFMSGSKDAYWQMELAEAESIGLIKIQLPSFGDCHGWWAFRGTKCHDVRPYGWFDQDFANTGMEIGVSNSADRKGTKCGRLDYAGSDNVQIDCKGAKGKYVYIKYPGNDRAISLRNVAVHKEIPVAEPDDYVCYGVEPRPQTATKPEFLIVQDPEDPIFYSTCYVREKDIEWIDLDQAVKKAAWQFNGQCIDCKNFDKNIKLDDNKLHTIRWEMSDQCLDCYAEAPPAEVPPPQEWVHAYSNRYCETSKNDCPTNTCIKRLYLLGRSSSNVLTDEEECKLVASKDAECSNHVMWNPRLDRWTSATCECYKKKSCCRECTPKTSSSNGYHIYELNSSSPVTDCGAPHILSEDGTMCCPASCQVEGENYCGTTNSDCNRKVEAGQCCKASLQKNCIDHGPPCLTAKGVTAAPTTKAPTTKAPTTKAPTTKAPTPAPITAAPTTAAPTAAAPTVAAAPTAP